MMDPGVEYERMLTVYERMRSEYMTALSLGDPRARPMYAALTHVESHVRRLQRLALQDARY